MTSTTAEGVPTDATKGNGQRTGRARPTRMWGMAWFATAGVLLPVVTLGFELATGMCSEMVFDPIPTWGHLLAVASVPALNLAVLHGLHRGRVLTRYYGWAGGVAFGVSIYYALLFLPMVPVAVMAVLFAGLGILPLAPLLATIAGVGILRRLRWRRVSARSIALGVVAGWALLLSTEAVPLTSDVLLAMAASDDTATSAKGVELLRRFGDRDQLLQACYLSRGSTASLAGVVHRQLAHMPTTEEARRIYFRVYGRPYSDAPRPPELGLWRARRWQPDEGRGGGEVAGRVPDLRLQSSRMDGSVDADASVGYLEWTLVFENAHALRPAEARAELALPSGATVSRATLWVDGEPREAAFASTGKARAAYQRVVHRRRDPLLITQTSPERVLVQCFPVPVGGTMKIRIGITFPVLPERAGEGAYALPYLTAQNFDIPKELRHAVWIESGAPIVSSQGGADGRLRTSLSTRELHTTLLRSPWSPDRISTALDGEHAVVRQRHERRPVEAPAHLVVVIDTSSSLASHSATIRETLGKYLRQTPTSLVLTADGAPITRELPTGAAPEALTEAFSEVAFEGGRDDSAALARAMALATEHGAPEVLWLHGPQPAQLGSVEPLNQLFERDEDAPVLVPLAFASGQNALLEALDPSARLRRPVRHGDALHELAHHLRSYGKRRFVPVRWREELPPAIDGADAGEPIAANAGRHVVRLWAADHVASGCDGLALQDCQALAAHYQLVSALSGAVVLEDEQQYQEASLQPVDPATVPSVPEPEEWLLMLTLLLALAGLALREQRRRTVVAAS